MSGAEIIVFLIVVLFVALFIGAVVRFLKK